MPALTHEFSETLNAPRERVFLALTDEAELCCWFAEHVEVEPHAGGEYRFWGSHTYGAPLRAQAAQKVVQIEPPRRLVFTWPLEGRDSEVTLELAEQGADATVLKGRHHFPDTPNVPRALDLIEDLWRMTLANLKAHLAGDAPVCRPDFSNPIPSLRQTVLIGVPRDTVFQALLETIEGGPTKILERVEDTKLVTNWHDRRGDAGPTRRVTWLLESIGEQSRVILIQEPFERTTDLSDYPQYWASVLKGLKARLEVG